MSKCVCVWYSGRICVPGVEYSYLACAVVFIF